MFLSKVIHISKIGLRSTWPPCLVYQRQRIIIPSKRLTIIISCWNILRHQQHGLCCWRHYNCIFFEEGYCISAQITWTNDNSVKLCCSRGVHSTLLVLISEYQVRTRSILWLKMTWLLVSWTTIVLNTQDNRIFVAHEEEFQISVLPSCREIAENAKMFVCSLKTTPHSKG